MREMVRQQGRQGFVTCRVPGIKSRLVPAFPLGCVADDGFFTEKNTGGHEFGSMLCLGTRESPSGSF